MVHNVALVLGGGGAAGNAWEIGVIAGLAEGGLDLTEVADLVIGTSAGATSAALVRSGIPAAELLASVLSPPARPGQGARSDQAVQSGGSGGSAGPNGPGGHGGHGGQGGPAGPDSRRGQAREQRGQGREQPPSLPMDAVFERMRAISAAATSAADLQRAMGAFGLESDAVIGSAAQARRAVVAARLPRAEWSDRPMIVVAVDAYTGELAAFDRDCGVDLADAVTASCALPGLVPTHAVNGSRYIDGGVRSAENADLASGYPNILVLSPLGGRSRNPAPGQFEGLRRSPDWGTDLTGQIEDLRKQGSRVELITPDADSLAAMGADMTDLAARIPSARAGFAQGKREAARVTFL